MLASALDSLIGVFSPKAAFQRAQFRNAVDKVRSKRSYDAAKNNRQTFAWNATALSADRAMRDADAVRNRARDLIRNNAYANGALEAIIANVVGCGITPKITDDRQREAWERWCEESDSQGRLHFYEQQALLLREIVEAGEGIVHYQSDSKRPSTRGVAPLMLELVEAERIDSSQDTSFGYSRKGSPYIRRGVQMDARGRPTGYYLFAYDPQDMSGYTNSTMFPARECLHLYKQHRIGQTRGMSWLAPVIMWLRDLGVYVENELQASAIASCFTAVIKTVDSGSTFGGLAGPSDADSSDTDGNLFENLQPGMVAHLMPGEDIVPINPGRPNSGSEPWINLILRSIAVGMGLSYELISRDYSKTDFSSNRASALEDRRRFRPLQRFLIWHLCRPVYQEWYLSNVLAGMEGFPSATEYLSSPAEFTNIPWIAPGWEWVDPLKEVQAAKLEVETGFRSRTDVIASRGGSIDQVFGELAKENEMAEDLDLNLIEDETNSASQKVSEQQAEMKTNAAKAKAKVPAAA